jgi:hypothetical protein
VTVLEGAEARFRELVQHAVQAGNYDDVAALAQVAKGLADLRNSLKSQRPEQAGNVISLTLANDHRDEDRLNVAGSAKQLRSNPNVSKATFPRFERHGNRLIKLGWSSKDKRIYEQRVPYEVVVEICRRFLEQLGSKKLLRVEELVPMKTTSGDDIPSYQLYLVLKWLQKHSALARQGKDGYSFSESDIDVKELWNLTDSRAS